MGVIFHLNSQDNRINLSAIVGDMKTKDNALPGLIASPVRDVIVDGNIVWEKNVTERNWGRFKKLLCYLRFESCIGVPVEAALHCEHALFLFHRKIDAFSRYRIRDTLASATLLSLALESSYLNRRIINLNSILLSGQLSAAFSHEVFNKVQGLDYQFKNLKIDYDKVLANNQNGESNSQAKKFDLALNDASGTVSGLVDTVTGFRRLIDTREELTEISINGIVLLASREIQQLADKHDIEVSLILEEHLPGAYGSQFGFYRVLT